MTVAHAAATGDVDHPRTLPFLRSRHGKALLPSASHLMQPVAPGAGPATLAAPVKADAVAFCTAEQPNDTLADIIPFISAISVTDVRPAGTLQVRGDGK